jgi:hypothetical protein
VPLRGGNRRGEAISCLHPSPLFDEPLSFVVVVNNAREMRATRRETREGGEKGRENEWILGSSSSIDAGASHLTQIGEGTNEGTTALSPSRHRGTFLRRKWGRPSGTETLKRIPPRRFGRGSSRLVSSRLVLNSPLFRDGSWSLSQTNNTTFSYVLFRFFLAAFATLGQVQHVWRSLRWKICYVRKA